MSWAVEFIRRRDAARAYLASKGCIPALLTRETAPPDALTMWSLPFYPGAFNDSDLIAIARKEGFDG
jgi:hypothetical protein